MSTTPSGLQALLDVAAVEIIKLGLNFNPKKTSCLALGKCSYTQSPSWTLNGEILNVVDELTYLGITLSNNQSHQHVQDRIRACTRSFYGLLPAGVTSPDMSPKIKADIWSTICRPSLMYGCATMSIGKGKLKEMETCQSKLIKQSLRISKLCHTSKLLNAMNINKVERSLHSQTLTLFASIMKNTSAATNFYLDLIDDNGAHKHSLLHRTSDLIYQHGLNLWDTVCASKAKLKAKLYPRHEQCGITDSIRTLLLNFTDFNRNLLNMLLFPI